MARRGERIGDAYVRIHADGSAIGKDVRKELDSLDKPIESKGADLGSGFSKGVAKGVKSNREVTNREILNSLEVSQGEVQKRGRLIAGQLMTGIRTQLAKTEGRDIANLMTNRLVQGIQEGTIKNKKALGELLADEQRFAQLRARAIGDLARLEAEAHTEALKLNKAFDDQRRLVEKLGPALGDTDRHMIRFRDNSRRFADGFGAAFGRGSRNDFINFTGSFVRNVLLAGSAVTRFSILSIRGFLQVASAGRVAFAEGGGIVGSLRAMGTEFATLAPRLAALVTSPQGLLGLAAGLGGVGLILSGVISLFVSLGGAAAALAVTIGGALVGGLILLGAALVPVTFGIGGLVAAILSLDDAAKASLKASVQPLIASFKELGQIVAAGAFEGIDKDVSRLTAAMDSPVFKTFATSLGFGLRRFREEMVEGLIESEGFFKALSKNGNQTLSIGKQIESLAASTRNLFSGIGGVILAAQIPLASFLHDLQDLTQDFKLFANDTSIGGGRDQITTFLTNALNSLRSLGSLLRSSAGLLVEVFNTGGADAGIALLDSFRGKIEELRNFIRSNPETVRQFFGDAVAVTRAVGNALLGVIGIFNALDTHASRQGVITFFNTMATVLDFLGQIIGFVTQQFDVLGGKFSIFGAAADFVSAMIPGVEGLKTGFSALKIGVDDTKTSVDTFNATPIAPTFNPQFVREAQVGFGTVLASGAELNNSVFAPQIPLQQIDAFDAHLRETARLAQEPKVVNVQAPQDPVLALIEKINFISLSLSAIKPANVTLRGAETINAVATRLRAVSTALAGLRPKVISVTAPTVNGVIARVAFLNAVTFRAKTLTINSNASSVLSSLSSIQSFTIADKEFTVTQRNRITGPNIRDARGAIEFPKYMAAGGFANFKQFYDPFTVIGESGREAIVPLDRPLGQVDPAVRDLAAFAQGKFDALLANAIGKQGINASGWVIMSNSEDPAVVADEVLNRIAGAGY